MAEESTGIAAEEASDYQEVIDAKNNGVDADDVTYCHPAGEGGRFLLDAKSILFMETPGLTSSRVHTSAEFKTEQGGGVVLHTGSVIYTSQDDDSAKLILWFEEVLGFKTTEAQTPTSSSGSSTSAGTELTTTVVARVYPATISRTNSRVALKANFSKEETVHAADIKIFQRGTYNQPANKALQDEMKKVDWKNRIFAASTDPNVAMEEFKTLRGPTDGAAHETAFKNFNLEAMVYRFITSMKLTGDRATALRSQFVLVIDLFYKYVVLKEDVPGDFAFPGGIVEWSLFPLGLASVLGKLEEVRAAPAIAGRETARESKNKKNRSKQAEKKKARATGAVPKARAVASGKTQAAGGKRGRPTGTTMFRDSDGNLKAHKPSGWVSCTATANRSSSSSSSSSVSNPDMRGAIDALKDEEIAELRKQVVLVKGERDTYASALSEVVAEAGKFQIKANAELRSRKSMCLMAAANTQPMSPTLVSTMMNDPSPMKMAPLTLPPGDSDEE